MTIILCGEKPVGVRFSAIAYENVIAILRGLSGRMLIEVLHYIASSLKNGWKTENGQVFRHTFFRNSAIFVILSNNKGAEPFGPLNRASPCRAEPFSMGKYSKKCRPAW